MLKIKLIIMKRYHNILLFTAFLAIQVPANAQQKKTIAGKSQKGTVSTPQKSEAPINTASWKAFDLGDYTFERRMPLTVKLPETVQLTKEIEDVFYYEYNIPLNKKLSIIVDCISNEKATMATDMARIQKVMDMIKKDGFTYKILIKEPEVFLIVVDLKKGKKMHMLTVYVHKPGDKVYYRFNSDTKEGDTHSDAEWIQLARSLHTSTVQ